MLDEIIEANVAGDNLIVAIHSHMKEHQEEALSFTLKPHLVLPSVAEMAKDAGLSIAQYAVSKFRNANDEQQREHQRLKALTQALSHRTPPSPEDQSLSIARNRIIPCIPDYVGDFVCSHDLLRSRPETKTQSAFYSYR